MWGLDMVINKQGPRHQQQLCWPDQNCSALLIKLRSQHPISSAFVSCPIKLMFVGGPSEPAMVSYPRASFSFNLQHKKLDVLAAPDLVTYLPWVWLLAWFSRILICTRWYIWCVQLPGYWIIWARYVTKLVVTYAIYRFSFMIWYNSRRGTSLCLIVNGMTLNAGSFFLTEISNLHNWE